MTLETRTWGNEVSWELLEGSTNLVKCRSNPVGSYGWHNTYVHPEKCNLCSDTEYKIHCKDSYGDGWHGGFLTIDGKSYCNDFCSQSCYGEGLYAPEGIPQTYGGTLRILPATNDGLTFSSSDGKFITILSLLGNIYLHYFHKRLINHIFSFSIVIKLRTKHNFDTGGSTTAVDGKYEHEYI